MVLILLLVLLCLYFFFLEQKNGRVEALARALVSYHVLLLLITNGLSLFSGFTKVTCFLSWCFVLFVLTFRYIYKYKKCYPLKKIMDQQLPVQILNRSLIEKIMLFVMVILFVVLFVGALFTVPYNYDSMTYHLARIGHWIDFKSVNHYVSNIDRQIYSPVLAEYNLLHIMSLSGSDTYVNFLQYFSMIGTCIFLYKTARMLGTSKVFSLFACFLFVTMPLTISQSVTTQNDLYATLWFSIFVYYLVTFIVEDHIDFSKEQRIRLILIGATVGFAFLAKTSICASALMFLPWLLLVRIKKKDKVFSLIKSAMLAGVTLVFVILETLVRNLFSSGSLMADTASANIMVATKNISYILVNILKNFSILITQHLYRPLNGFVYRIAISLGAKLKVQVNHEAISYHGFDFIQHMNMGDDMYSHDKTPSAFVTYMAFFVILIVFGILIRNVRKKEFQGVSIGYAISCWLSLGFIMALLRWQPWGTRLMYPALAMTVVMIANVLGYLLKSKKAIVICLFPMICLSVLLCSSSVVYNMKPAVENLQSGLDNRMQRYFTYNDRYATYLALIDEVQKQGFTDVGVVISGDGYDYPLWLMFREKEPEVRLRHILLDQKEKEVQMPECILYIERGALTVGETLTYQGTLYRCSYVYEGESKDAILIRE